VEVDLVLHRRRCRTVSTWNRSMQLNGDYFF